MAFAKGFVIATAVVAETDHNLLRSLLAGRKLLPHKTFSDWLRAAEAEALKGKRK